MNYFNYHRRKSSVVQVGNVPLGGDNNIRIQSMANTSTMDTEASVRQAVAMIEAGAEYVRFTAQGEREAANLANIRKRLDAEGLHAPLVADIHFNPKAADEAALHVEKVRINPGNYVDKAKRFETIDYTNEEYAEEIRKIKERFIPFLNLCRKHNTAIRIGVNHGSLSDRIMSRYGDTPEGMVESCMEFLRICKEEKFDNVVISIKASNTIVMIRTVRLLVKTMEAEDMHYPLHLGVTEAGDGEDGRIKSAVGIGTLLADGIGDTIRVSLSEAPEAELPVARKLVNHITARANHTPIKATKADNFDYINPVRRKTRPVCGIGGDNVPVVISYRSNGDNEIGTLVPDWIFSNDKIKQYGERNEYPVFSILDIDKFKNDEAEPKFITLTYQDLSDDIIGILKDDKTTVAILESEHINPVGEMRAFFHKLMIADCNVPVIIKRTYNEDEAEDLQIKAAADFGALLADGFGDGIMLCNNGTACSATVIDNYMFGILQAVRARISKTEYISCPSCGRTMYDMQTTIARIKAATSDMKGLKIGIMGCIVNGPGEMADADYGYVGAGRGRISLYKGKECVLKNIPEDEAVERLIELIEK